MTDCPHIRYEMRKKKASDSRYMVANQCLECGGKVGNWIATCPLGVADWDDAIAANYWKSIREQSDADRRAKDDAWWSWYKEYLRSPQWQEKSRRVLARNPICQACGDRRATQAHHSYEHSAYRYAGDEPLFVLVAICKECHTKITQARRREMKR